MEDVEVAFYCTLVVLVELHYTLNVHVYCMIFEDAFKSEGSDSNHLR